MKIQYASDLHLEFEINSYFLKQNPLLPVGDILILAGDISYLRPDFYDNPFFDYVSQNWKAVYWLPGNHEFYCGIDINEYDFSDIIEIRNNVYLINNKTVEIDCVHFIFSTLWSKIEAKYAAYVVQNVSDFECIVWNNEKLTAKSFNQLHSKSLRFIKSELERLKSKTKVIVTHHLPSNQCNAMEFLGSKINSAFCTELSSFVKNCKADYWIYGHSHRNIPEFQIGKTKMITNQIGYIQYDEQKQFKRDACFEI
jgi:Icc-related predicted phosphoesterase